MVFMIAAALGVLHALSFPWDGWLLQSLSFSGFIALLLRFEINKRNRSVREYTVEGIKARFALSFVFSLAWFATGVSWVYHSMHAYGGMPALLAGVSTLVFCATLALFPSLAFALSPGHRDNTERLKSHPLRRALLLTALLAAAEWLRGHVATGFPWLAMGYAHTEGPLSGWAPVLGLYGVSALATLISVCLGHALHQRQQRALLISIAIVTLLGGALLKEVEWTKASGEPLHVALIQSNITQTDKFAPEQLGQILSQLEQQAASIPAQLIAFPETAIPIFHSRIPDEWFGRLRTRAEEQRSVFLVGLPFDERDAIVDGQLQSGRYFNTVLAYGPPPSASTTSSGAYARYDKAHLVPFGEYVPWGFRWFVNLMQIPLGDFGRGAEQQAPIPVRDQRVAVNICYEDIFPAEIALNSPSSTLLLNVSNIAWFGDSWAVPQHLQISRMRALENQRPMLRATNTGATAIIDHKGQVIRSLPPFVLGVLEGHVQGRTGLTPYQQWRDLPTIGLILAILIGNVLLPQVKSGHRLS